MKSLNSNIVPSILSLDISPALYHTIDLLFLFGCQTPLYQRSILYPFLNLRPLKPERVYTRLHLHGVENPESFQERSFVAKPRSRNFFVTNKTGIPANDSTKKLLCRPLYTEARSIGFRRIMPKHGYKILFVNGSFRIKMPSRKHSHTTTTATSGNLMSGNSLRLFRDSATITATGAWIINAV